MFKSEFYTDSQIKKIKRKQKELEKWLQLENFLSQQEETDKIKNAKNNLFLNKVKLIQYLKIYRLN